MQTPIFETQITIRGQKIGRYILEKRLGSGQFGTVWRARTEDTGEVFAVKKIKMESINKSKEALNLLKTEISIMNEINHPNILHLYEFIYSKKHYYLVVQYCEQRDFESYMTSKGIRYFEEAEAVYFLKQIMNGFVVLRERKILHRDFKLANLFMHEDRIVIGDFGFAKQGFDVAQTKLGTPVTMAPELLFAGDDEKVVYNSKADLWSIGVVFYQILFGRLPFNGNTIPELIRDIRKVCREGIPFPRPVSEDARSLIKGLLTIDPKQRIEWDVFFHHPIFSNKENSDMRKIERAFGDIGKMNASSIDDEFRQNAQKKRAGQPDNLFLNNAELAQLAKSPAGREVAEATLNPAEQAKLVAESLSKEVNYRLSHELNKVYFLIYTVHKVQKSQKNPELLRCAAAGLNLSILLLMRAKFMNTRVRNCVERRVNVFRLADVALGHFYKSEHAFALLNYLTMNEKSLSDHLVLLLRRCKENKIELSCRHLISKDVDEAAVVVGCNQETSKFLGLLPPDNFPDRALARTVVLLRVLGKLALNLEASLAYFTPNSGDAKFNWNRLYYILERVPVEELRNSA